jgi:cystathionine beta-lyase
MKNASKVTHLGRKPHQFEGVVNPPVMHASTILFKDYEEYKSSRKGGFLHSTYGRYGTSVTKDFAQTLADLDGGHNAIITASGVSAFTTALLGLLQAGDHLLVTDSVYDPTRKFCQQELSRFGITTTFYDPLIGGNIAEMIQENTRLIFCESPGSLTFEIQDIPAIAKAAHAKGALVMLDNTYAAPLLNRPFELGADVVIYSASKYVSGHSDLIMGVISATEETYPKILRAHKNIGACPGPDDVYLAQRGLRTLSARLAQHETNALKVAEWLQSQPEVSAVFHPALLDCPGHEIFARDFSGSNGLFGFVMDEPGEAAMSALVDHLKFFGMGYSWGGYESLMIPLWLDPIRSVLQYNDGRYMRIHIGLEDVDDLIEDLDAGFERMRKTR